MRGDAADWDERYAAVERVWSVEPNRWLEEIAAPLRPGRALDLACGEGRNAVWLAQRGWDVTAVDFSAVGLAKGRDEAPDVDWVEADVRAWLPPAGAFDFVAVLYLHLPPAERATVLAAAAAAVAPGGTLLVVGHDRRNLDEGVGGPQVPSILLVADEVAEELPGLDVERAETVERPVGDAVALDTLVLARR